MTSLSDITRCACGPRTTLGALLYHSYGDVAAEKIRINAVVSQTVDAWNQCSDSATDATGQQLSTDFGAWYQTWTDFTNNGSSNEADFPDNDEWDTMQSYEQQLVSLTARINAYCNAGLPGPAPTGTSPANPLAIAAAAATTIALAIVAIELAPVLSLAVTEATKIVALVVDGFTGGDDA